MKIVDKVAKSLGYCPINANRRHVKASRVQDMNFAQWENTVGLSKPTVEDLIDCYSATDWVYRAVKAIADTASGVPIKFYTGKSDDDKIEITKGLPELFWKPNEYMGYEELIQCWVIHLQLVGYGFSEKVQRNPKSAISATNPIVELHPLIPQYVKIMPDAKERIAGYVYELNQKKFTFTPDELLHLKYIDPKRPDGYGVSPLAAARMSCALDLYSTTWNVRFFQNGAEPGSMIESDKDLTIEQVSRLRKDWEAMHKGANRAHKLGILPFGLKWKSTTPTAKDMQFIETQKFSGERILRVFGVPPVMAGVLEYSNYSLAIEQRKLFWETTIIPLLRMLSGQIDRGICSYYGPDVWCEFDLSGVQALQEDENAKATRAASLVQAGIWTPNEARNRLWSMDPIPGGDAARIPGVLPFGAAAPVMDDTEDEAPVDDMEEMPDDNMEDKRLKREPLPIKKAYTPDEMRKSWEAFIKRADPLEAEMRWATSKFFSEQLTRIESNLGSSKAITKATVSVTDIFDDDLEDAELWKALEKYIKKAVRDGAMSVADDYGVPVDFNMSDPKVVAFLKKKKLNKIKTINATTREEMRRILLESRDAGESIPQLAKRIRDYWDEMDAYRSERIARTETGGALNFGALRGYEKAGYMRKGWSGQMDGFIRDDHAEATNRYSGGIPIDEPFIVGGNAMAYPCDPDGEPEQIINCRCAMVPFAE